MATKTLTKAQWKQLEQDIWDIQSPKLLIDGHEIAPVFIIDRRKMRVVFRVYIDGFIHGEMLDKDHPVGRKFWCIKTMKPGLASARNAEKTLGKRMAKRLRLDVDSVSKIEYLVPHFSSFKTMRLTWEKNCDSIELLTK